MPTRLRLVLPDSEWLAQAHGALIRLEDVDQPFRISGGESGRYLVSGPDGDLTLTAVAAGDAVWVGYEGHVLEVKIQPASARAHTRGRDHDVLGPPMPATVVRIDVRPGDAVRAGDVLIALEAMKMELPIRAPRDGVVTAIHCREGELVQPGAALVELE